MHRTPLFLAFLMSMTPPLVQLTSNTIASPSGFLWRFFVVIGFIGPLFFPPQYLFAALVLWLPIVVGIGAILRSCAARHEQRTRDKNAEKLLEQVLSGKTSRFVLYLRPFFLASHVQVKTRDNSYSGFWKKWFYPDADFEWIIRDGVRSIGPLMGLTEPGEGHSGAGRISLTLDPNKTIDWKSSIETLIETSELVIVIPSVSSGMTWELDLLKRKQLLHKCVFVIPPRASSGFDDLHDQERN